MQNVALCCMYSLHCYLAEKRKKQSKRTPTEPDLPFSVVPEPDPIPDSVVPEPGLAKLNCPGGKDTRKAITVQHSKCHHKSQH